MEYRKLGNSDLNLSAVTFGAWAIGGWMWGGADKQDALTAIKTAVDNGMISIDTAPAYGQGHSEELVGEAIKDYSRDKVHILTKYGLRWDTDKGEFYFDSKDNQGKDIKMHKYAGKESVMKECEDSLRRLKTDYIDLYQIHWADPTTPIHETMEAIIKLKEQGKIRYAGVCNYTAEQMKEAQETVDIISNQVPYSMLKKDIEKEVVPYCLDNTKGILAYSPMQGGLLTGKFSKDHEFKENDHRKGSVFYQPENIERINQFLDKIKPIAEDKNATLAELCIRWTLEQPGITIALVGARNKKQVMDNIKAGDLKLSKEEIETINQHLGELELVQKK